MRGRAFDAQKYGRAVFRLFQRVDDDGEMAYICVARYGGAVLKIQWRLVRAERKAGISMPFSLWAPHPLRMPTRLRLSSVEQGIIEFKRAMLSPVLVALEKMARYISIDGDEMTAAGENLVLPPLLRPC